MAKNPIGELLLPYKAAKAGARVARGIAHGVEAGALVMAPELRRRKRRKPFLANKPRG